MSRSRVLRSSSSSLSWPSSPSLRRSPTTTIQASLTRLKKTRAIADIKQIAQLIEEFNETNGRYPSDLSELNRGPFTDPWGRPYEYVLIGNDTHDRWRADRANKPINTHFDLWSCGTDGQSQKQVRASQSRDDIIRAWDGTFSLWTGWGGGKRSESLRCLTLLLVLLFYVVVRDGPEVSNRKVRATNPPRMSSQPLADLRLLLKNRDYWIISYGSFVRYGIFAAFQTLWAGPFLMEGIGLSAITAGNLIFLLNVGLLLSGPLWGAFSDRVFKTRKWLVCWDLGVLSLLLVFIAFTGPRTGLILLLALFFSFGLFQPGTLMYVQIEWERPLSSASERIPSSVMRKAWTGSEAPRGGERRRKFSVSNYSANEMMALAAGRFIKDGDIVFAGTGVAMLAATAAKRIYAPKAVVFFESRGNRSDPGGDPHGGCRFESHVRHMPELRPHRSVFDCRAPKTSHGRLSWSGPDRPIREPEYHLPWGLPQAENPLLRGVVVPAMWLPLHRV